MNFVVVKTLYFCCANLVKAIAQGFHKVYTFEVLRRRGKILASKNSQRIGGRRINLIKRSIFREGCEKALHMLSKGL